jgi:preprotein translocase subunit SecE
MNEPVRQTEAGDSSNAPLWIAALLLLAGVAGYYVLSAQPGWVRWLSVVAGAAVGATVFILSPIGRDFRQFVVDARNELRKVFWPTKQETWQTTLVVFIFAVVAGIFFWLLDLLLTWATSALSGQGG